MHSTVYGVEMFEREKSIAVEWIGGISVSPFDGGVGVHAEYCTVLLFSSHSTVVT